MDGKVQFRELHNPGKVTKLWGVQSVRTGEPMGLVKWYIAKKQYIFNPAEHVFLDADSLRQVAEFCDGRTRESAAGA